MLSSTSAIKDVPEAMWETFFEATGYPDGCEQGAVSHRQVLAAFSAGTHQSLVDAVDAVARLGEDDARNELFDADPTLLTPDRIAAAPAELALELWLASRTSPDLEETLRRVMMVMTARASKRAMHMFRAKGPVDVGVDLRALEVRLRDLLAPQLKTKGFRGDVEVEVRRDATNALQVAINRGSRSRARRVVEPARHVRKAAEEEDDAVRLWAGCIKIVAARGLVEIYRKALGEALMENPELFSEREMFDLDGLLDGSVDLQQHGLGDLVSVRLIELEVQRGTTHLWVKSPDGETELKRQPHYFHGSKVRNAKLKVVFSGPDRSDAIVSIGAPNHFSVSRPSVEGHVERYLEAIRVIRSANEAGTHRSLWEVVERPLSGPEGEVLFGRRWRELIDEGIFRETQQRRVPPPGMAGAGPLLRVDKSGSRTRGVAEDETIASVPLTSTHLLRHELQLEALAVSFSRAIGIVGKPRELLPDFAGTFDLGTRQLRSQELRVFLVGRELDALGFRALASTLEDLVGGHRLVVLSPLTTNTDVLESSISPLNLPWPALDDLFPRIVQRFKLEDEVDAVHRVPRSVRLVIDRAKQRVWFDGAEIALNDGHQFDLIHHLAEHARSGNRTPLTEDDLRARLRTNDGGRVRRVFGQVIDAVKKALDDGLMPVPDDLRGLFKASKGYRFSGSAMIV